MPVDFDRHRTTRPAHPSRSSEFYHRRQAQPARERQPQLWSM